MGVVAVETRTTETIIAADPANESSTEQLIPEAGQVWHPNSAFKTAQAINDFNKGEQLPLIIFANWRGFSGGQQDMFKEILKYGADIVDALVDYKQPIFVYIVGELRGGAWVVLDPTINPDMMEMYAETNSRGGVLEPEGLVEIKFRKAKLLSTMERLDDKYATLKQNISRADLEASELEELLSLIKEREALLLPLYHSAALQFADLHDRPARMVAKGVIRGIVDWKQSRNYFYYRLLRRISEEQVIKKILAADETETRNSIKKMLASWFAKDTKSFVDYATADRDVIQWLSEVSIESRISLIRSISINRRVSDLIKEDPIASLEGFLSCLPKFDERQKALLIEKVRGL